jgi:hypothetical protein
VAGAGNGGSGASPTYRASSRPYQRSACNHSADGAHAAIHGCLYHRLTRYLRVALNLIFMLVGAPKAQEVLSKTPRPGLSGFGLTLWTEAFPIKASDLVRSI